MDIGSLVNSLFTSSGPGGIIIFSVITTAALVYFWLTRWIILGNEEDED